MRSIIITILFVAGLISAYFLTVNSDNIHWAIYVPAIMLSTGLIATAMTCCLAELMIKHEKGNDNEKNGGVQ